MELSLDRTLLMHFSVLDPGREVFLHLVIPSWMDELLMQTLLPGFRHIFGSYLYLFLPPTYAIFTTEGKETRRFPIFFSPPQNRKPLYNCLVESAPGNTSDTDTILT